MYIHINIYIYMFIHAYTIIIFVLVLVFVNDYITGSYTRFACSNKPYACCYI